MAAANKQQGGLWSWVQDVGKTCGFAQQPQPPPMWVRANPDLFPQEVPGMGEELLSQASQPGGDLEEKIQAVIDAFRASARHLESLQQVLRRRALDRREKAGEENFPVEVEEVISEGTYSESFLEAFDGQNFLLFTEEIVPCHAYRLALEVHSGGAYWSSIPVQDGGSVRHTVETVSASSSLEGTASIISHFGAAQRGAVFVWRWQHLLDKGPYNVPEWLSRALGAEGNDPLRKLMAELEAIRRWEEQAKLETARYVKHSSEVKDPYIREVLRLWPAEPDAHGMEQLKKCAWVEGLDPRLFVGRTVPVRRVPYDSSHALTLHAVISKRHAEEPAKERDPPYRLTTTWQWASGKATPSSSRKPQDSRPGSTASLAPSVPGTDLDLSRVGTATSLALSEATRAATATMGSLSTTMDTTLAMPPIPPPTR